MERKLLFATVLILELAGVFSFYIADVNNQSAVYEVKEDETTHTLTITNPKPEKPVLREIIYYHVIEKPYDQVITFNNITNNGNKNNNVLDDIQNENSSKTAIKSKFGSENITERNNIKQVSNDNMTDNDSNIENMTNNIENLIDNENRISGDITIDTNYFDDDKRVSISYTNNNDKDEAKKVDSIDYKYNVKATNLTDISETVAKNNENITHIEKTINKKHNLTINNKIIAKKLMVDNADSFIPHSNIDNIDVDNASSVTENVYDKSVNLTNAHNINSNINVTPNILKNTQISPVAYNIIENGETFIRTEKFANTEDTNDIKHSNNTLDVDNDEKIEAITNDKYTRVLNGLDGLSINDETNKLVNTDNEPFIYTIDEYIASNENVITEHNNKFTNTTATLEKDIENKIFYNNTEVVTNANYINSQDLINNDLNMPNKDTVDVNEEDAFIIIVDDKFINFHNKIIDEENDVNNKTDKGSNKISENNESKKNIDKSNNMIAKENNIINSDSNENDNTIKNKVLINVENDYENPYDAKEGVKFSDRHFTNGQGFQYFYPDPENQDFSEDPAAVDVKTVSDLENVSNFSEQVKLKDATQKKSATVVDSDLEKSDIVKKEGSKREIATLLPLNEEYAPEDLLINVMDKVSERVKRTVEREKDTYGMRLTGDKGVVWNDSKTPNESALRARRNDNEENGRTKNSNESSSVEASKENHKSEINTVMFDTEELKKSDKTFGMSLTGGHGTVWNNLNGNRISYDVGEPQNKNILPNNVSKDNEIINKKIEAFHSFIRDAPSTDNTQNKCPNLTTTSTVNSINQMPSTVKSIAEKPSTKKSIAEETSTKKPIAIITTTEAPSITKTSIVESNIEVQKLEKTKIEEPNVLDKTYGMSLTGDQGIVWNDLNGRRDVYRIRDEKSQTSKANKDDQQINVSSEQFQKSLKGAATNKETRDKSSTDLNTEEPFTMLPKIEQLTEKTITKLSKIEPLTEKPIIKISKIKPLTKEPITKISKIESLTEESIIYEPETGEPKTNRPILFGPTTEKRGTNEQTTEASNTDRQNEPVKTYGMSLTRDHGLIWNDLYGDRLSYHVKSNENLEENYPYEVTTGRDLSDISKPIDVDNNKSKDGLINDIDEVFQEINNILANFSKEIEKSANDTSKTIANKVNIVKGTVANETAKLKEELKDWMKEEVAKQIKEYFATHSEIKSSNNNVNDDNVIEIVRNNKENDEILSKKRKNWEEKKEKEPSKVIATNIYGNSMGDGNVTNIFIFNINNGSDTNNIIPPINETGGINVLVIDNQKPDEGIKEDEQEAEVTTTEKVTPRPDEDNVDDQTKENSKETAITPEKENSHEIANKDELHDYEITKDAENTNESTSAIPEDNNTKYTTVRQETNPNDVQDNPKITEKISNSSGEQNGNSEKPNYNSKEPNDTAEHKNNSGEKKVNLPEQKDNSAEQWDYSAEQKVSSVKQKDDLVEDHYSKPKNNSKEQKIYSADEKENTAERDGNATEKKDSSAEKMSNSEKKKDDSAENKGNTVVKKDNLQEQKNSSTEQRDNSVEQKVNSVEQKDDLAEKYNSSKLKNNSKEQKINSAEEKDNPAEWKGNSTKKKDNSDIKDNLAKKKNDSDKKKDNSAEKNVNSVKQKDNLEKKINSAEHKDNPAVQKGNSTKTKDSTTEKKSNSEKKKDDSAENKANAVVKKDNSAKKENNPAEKKDNLPEQKDNSTEQRDNPAEQKVNSVKQKDDLAKKDNSSKPKNNSKEQKINSAEQKDNRAERKGNSAEKKDNSAIKNSSAKKKNDSKQKKDNSAEKNVNSVKHKDNLEKKINSAEHKDNPAVQKGNSTKTKDSTTEKKSNSEKKKDDSAENKANAIVKKDNSAKKENNSAEKKDNSKESNEDLGEPLSFDNRENETSEKADNEIDIDVRTNFEK